MTLESTVFKKEPIRHDLRESSFTIKGYEKNPDIYHITVKETSCVYDTKTTNGKYFAQLVDCHRHSEGIHIIVETEIHPIHKDTLKELHLIPVKPPGKNLFGKIKSFLSLKYEYLLDPYFKSEGMANDRPDKKDGRYEEFLDLLRRKK